MTENRPKNDDDGLSEQNVDPNPLRQFQKWFREAAEGQSGMPEAMTLATATKSGRPSARLVLLKSADESGFVFYTNYNSRKARDLAENPFAALVFYWPAVDRQVRVEGRVTKVSPEESDAYFGIRPRESQLGAIASAQSEPLGSRTLLEERVRELDRIYSDKSPPRPVNWGGYRLKPDRLEFWKSRTGRLHDRILFELQQNGVWRISRLAP